MKFPENADGARHSSAALGMLSVACTSVTISGQGNNNNNNNNQYNVYGAVIMAEPLREFTRFIWWM